MEKKIVEKETQTEKILNFLGLARRAGKLEFGFLALKKSLGKRKVKLIILAEDIAERTEKDIAFLNKNNVPAIKFGQKDIFGQKFKRRNPAILFITDDNFSKGILKLI
ncbi:MAG: hypothetical protein CSB55_01825 [Candidatus Cloacimonadota bacterium]|nr:MAG: hypothetical protein CSB55_01825 [Candidatus Cloacimonadota bacterium]